MTPLLSALLFGASSMAIHAQPQRPGPTAEEPRFLYYEVVNVAAADTTLARIDVLYRVDAEFFIALKNPDAAQDSPFVRRGEILIELLDSTDTSRKRAIERLLIPAAAPGPTLRPRNWLTGRASFEIPPGLYRVLLEISDLESDRRFVERERTIRARSPVIAGRVPFTPLLLATVPAESTLTILPQNYGGDALFGMPGGVSLEIPGLTAGGKAPLLRYSLAALPFSASDEPLVLRTDTIAASAVIPGATLTPSTIGTAPAYVIERVGSTTLVLFPLPLEELPLRSYDMKGVLETGSESIEFQRRFRMVWPDMPLSLRNIDLALDALSFITSESQLDSLKSGSFAERVLHLEGFWRAKDRTPRTAANEVMTEYYRRVDYATRAFSTLRDPDGLRTDRGRIYVLHGPPTHTERTLDPEKGFREVWVYEQPPKRFVFIDQARSGSYMLQSPGGR